MVKEKDESPQKAEAEGEHQVQGELQVRGHVLAPEEMGHCGHDGDQGDAAEDDKGQYHHVITQEVQLAMINASKSEKQESRHHQNLQTQISTFHFSIATQYSPAPGFWRQDRRKGFCRSWWLSVSSETDCFVWEGRCFSEGAAECLSSRFNNDIMLGV